MTPLISFRTKVFHHFIGVKLVYKIAICLAHYWNSKSPFIFSFVLLLVIHIQFIVCLWQLTLSTILIYSLQNIKDKKITDGLFIYFCKLKNWHINEFRLQAKEREHKLQFKKSCSVVHKILFSFEIGETSIIKLVLEELNTLQRKATKTLFYALLKRLKALS